MKYAPRTNVPESIPVKIRPLYTILDNDLEDEDDDMEVEQFADLTGNILIDRDGGDGCGLSCNQIAFVCGPEEHRDGEDFLSDFFSAYDWMKDALMEYVESQGWDLEIGGAENYHMLTIDDMTVEQADAAFIKFKELLTAKLPEGVSLNDTSVITGYHKN